MKIGDTKIIDSREDSTPASAWSEDLCLKRIDDVVFELFIGGYGVVAERSDFFDEETEEENIPEEIDGFPVQGVWEDYVLGGQIGMNESDGEVRFSVVDSNEVKDWLKSINWNEPDTIAAIKGALDGSEGG